MTTYAYPDTYEPWQLVAPKHVVWRENGRTFSRIVRDYETVSHVDSDDDTNTVTYLRSIRPTWITTGDEPTCGHIFTDDAGTCSVCLGTSWYEPTDVADAGIPAGWSDVPSDPFVSRFHESKPERSRKGRSTFKVTKRGRVHGNGRLGDVSDALEPDEARREHRFSSHDLIVLADRILRDSDDGELPLLGTETIAYADVIDFRPDGTLGVDGSCSVAYRRSELGDMANLAGLPKHEAERLHDLAMNVKRTGADRTTVNGLAWPMRSHAHYTCEDRAPRDDDGNTIRYTWRDCETSTEPVDYERTTVGKPAPYGRPWTQQGIDVPHTELGDSHTDRITTVVHVPTMVDATSDTACMFYGHSKLSDRGELAGWRGNKDANERKREDACKLASTTGLDVLDDLEPSERAMPILLPSGRIVIGTRIADGRLSVNVWHDGARVATFKARSARAVATRA